MKLQFRKIENAKRDHLDLLLLGDESETMIDKYINGCEVYGGFLNDEIVAICAVQKLDNQTIEIKNLAVDVAFQKQGFGREMIDFICEQYKNDYNKIILGTGDVPTTTGFYEKCGFTRSHIVKNFFVDNYPEPIIENGIQLADMVYFLKEIL